MHILEWAARYCQPNQLSLLGAIFSTDQVEMALLRQQMLFFKADEDAEAAR